MQSFGIGTAVAIFLDATLVRGILVPAVMRLARAANWWAPARLRPLSRAFANVDNDVLTAGRSS